MDLILNLDESSWKLKLSDDYTEVQDDRISLRLDLLEIEKIKQPYTEMSEHKEVEYVMSSIKRDQFLHPIFVFRTESKNMVLADGAHRIQALKEMGCSLVPSIILDEKTTRKDSWIKLFHSKVPSYKLVYKYIAPNQRKHIIHQQFDLLSIDTLIDYQYRKNILAIYKDAENIHIFSFKNLKDSNRKEKLQLIKMLDQILDTESQGKSYAIVTKANEDQFNYYSYLMIPPPSDSIELDLLIKFPELRRPKAFCIKPAIRMVYLPISVGLLKNKRKEAISELKQAVNARLPDFKTIYLKLSFSKSLDLSWYYQILIICSLQNFLTDVVDSEKDLLQDLLEGVELLNENYQRVIV